MKAFFRAPNSETQTIDPALHRKTVFSPSSIEQPRWIFNTFDEGEVFLQIEAQIDLTNATDGLAGCIVYNVYHKAKLKWRKPSKVLNRMLARF